MALAASSGSRVPFTPSQSQAWRKAVAQMREAFHVIKDQREASRKLARYDAEEDRKPFRLPLHATGVLTILLLLVLWVGLYPDPLVNLTEAGSRALFGG